MQSVPGHDRRGNVCLFYNEWIRETGVVHCKKCMDSYIRHTGRSEYHFVRVTFMSTAYFSQGMRPMGAGGFAFNSSNMNVAYVPWKSTGVFANPVGVTATHIRPLTNRDPGNVFPTGFGLPRPIKHYRKGTVLRELQKWAAPALADEPAAKAEQAQIAYNLNRAVKSSTGSSLGGGNGGTGMIAQVMEMPGATSFKENQVRTAVEVQELATGNTYTPAHASNGEQQMERECDRCTGVGVVSSWMPVNNLTEKPQANMTAGGMCCNQQRKAITRTLGASTNVKKNYYQTTGAYLYNRCQTFEQREFNFLRAVDPWVEQAAKEYALTPREVEQAITPGAPMSLGNYYVAQCNPNSMVAGSVELDLVQRIGAYYIASGKISEEQWKSYWDAVSRGETDASIAKTVAYLSSLLSEEEQQKLKYVLRQIASDPQHAAVITGPSNPRGCARVYYKPNNPQFAQQGAVSSATRTWKLQADTITTAAARTPLAPYVNKNKTNLECQRATYVGNPFFFSGLRQNKQMCMNAKTGAEYRTSVSVYQRSRGNYIGATLP